MMMNMYHQHCTTPILRNYTIPNKHVPLSILPHIPPIQNRSLTLTLLFQDNYTFHFIFTLFLLSFQLFHSLSLLPFQYFTALPHKKFLLDRQLHEKSPSHHNPHTSYITCLYFLVFLNASLLHIHIQHSCSSSFLSCMKNLPSHHYPETHHVSLVIYFLVFLNASLLHILKQQ